MCAGAFGKNGQHLVGRLLVRWMMMMTMISSFSFSVFLGSTHLTQPTKHLEEFLLIFLAL
jgi:hypothetical protein